MGEKLCAYGGPVREILSSLITLHHSLLSFHAQPKEGAGELIGYFLFVTSSQLEVDLLFGFQRKHVTLL